MSESVVEHVLNQLDEYGDPRGSLEDDMADAMVEAAKVFLAVVRAELPVWACDEMDRFEVNVAEWREATE